MEELIRQLLAKVEALQAEQRQMAELLRHGVTPPEWVSGKALALSLGIKARAVEFYRYDLGVIPVDGEVCRRAGKGYEYRVEGCRRLIEEYNALPAETRRAIKESWQQCREVA
jgi:hypothetical protein